MRRKIVVSLAVICCLSIGTSFAQTTTTTTKTKTTSKKTSSVKTRVHGDATRLAALLSDAQTTVTVSNDVWRTIGNEANSLANRLYGATSGNSTARTAARHVREHVREFRAAAQAGNASEARDHANMAMPFLNQLIDWAS